MPRAPTRFGRYCGVSFVINTTLLPRAHSQRASIAHARAAGVEHKHLDLPAASSTERIAIGASEGAAIR
jgi:hypothetical protein